MVDQARFSRDPQSPARRLAAGLALADQELRVALVQARHDACMSQQDVATALGISQAAVSQFERYDNDPRLSTVRRYALAVGAAVAHKVDGATGRTWECGTWSTAWQPTTPVQFRYLVNTPRESLSFSLPAPDTVSTDLALAA